MYLESVDLLFVTAVVHKLGIMSFLQQTKCLKVLYNRLREHISTYFYM